MRKLFPALLLFLFAALRAQGQSTTVSGQVTDAGAQAWANGTFQASFTPNPQFPGAYTWSGGTLRTTISGTLNGSGAYSVSIPSNTAISPIGSTWTFQFCSQATSPCFTTQNITITGTTQTLNVTPPAISISLTNPTAAPVVAYSDAEITSAGLGSYYYSIPNQTFRVCQAVSGQVCTLFANIGTGGPSGFPRLDQVLDQNTTKTFNQGTSPLGFSNGAFSLAGETSPFTLPLIGSCATTANGQICFDPASGNYHFYNGADSLLPLFTSSFVSGDVMGLSLAAGKWTVTDLGPLGGSSGSTVVQANITNIMEGDSLCWDSGTSIFVNCTPGVPPVVISGATYNYDGTGSASPERGDILFFTNAGGAALSFPQPSPSGVINANWFTFIKADGGTLTLTVGGTGIFNDNGTNSITVAKGTGCSIFSDPSGVGTIYTKCAMVPLTAGSGVTITPAAYSIAIAATGSGGTITGSGTANTMTKFTGSAAVGNSSCTDDGTNPTRCPNGSNTATDGNYEEYTVDTGGVTAGLALCATSNVDGSGRPKVLPCSHSAAQPGAGFVGIARTTVAAAGTVSVCWTVNCNATFDNTSVALNEAILSVTTDGRLHDTGAQTATAGQPNFAVLNANTGTGTNSLISLTGMLAQNPAGGGNGGKGTQVAVAGTNTKSTANFVAGTGITLTPVNSGNTTTVTVASTSSGGVTSINTSATGPAVTINGAGSTNITTSGNTITVNGINGPPAPTVNTISGTTYSVQNSDNSWRDKFTSSSAVAVTLPQANTISSAPFVASRFNNTISSCTTCTTSSFSQNAGDILVVAVTWSPASNEPGFNSVTDTAGDTFVADIPVQRPTSGSNQTGLAIYHAQGIAASGGNTISLNMAGASTLVVSVAEYNAVAFDHGAGSNALDNATQSVTIPLTALNEIIYGIAASCPSGWTTRGALSGLAQCERLVSGQSNSTLTQLPIGGGGNSFSIGEAGYSITASPVFTAGWYVVLENAGTNLDTVTPTTSTINGQTTLVIVPNEACAIMSDGANYDAMCWMQPNRQFNGAIGGAIQIGYAQQLSRNSDLTATTINTTGASDAFYTVDADINCDSSVSTGIATLTFTFTDTSNTVQTYSTNAACTTLGSSSIGSIRQAFRAKASTNIQYTLTHTGTQPTFDVSVAVNQLSTK